MFTVFSAHGILPALSSYCYTTAMHAASTLGQFTEPTAIIVVYGTGFLGVIPLSLAATGSIVYYSFRCQFYCNRLLTCAYVLDVELETWVEPTIQDEIARGEVLQKQKAISAAINNLVYIKSPRLAKGGLLNRSRKSPIRKWRRSHSPVVKRTSASTTRDDSYSSNRNPRMGRPVCSMRISELAAPTKRQCIASWRANANILPENMVNRLKKRVMDQEPIVKVSDAVNCIKQVKPPSDSQSTVIWKNKRPTKKLNKAEMDQRVRAETQVLSDVFGKKMTQHLMKTMSITLNPRLKRVSNIVSEEINKILKDTKTLRSSMASNERMVQEISEKVTIWIAKILDDSTEKLLEEDLKELEEQEGPVLDVLDDIVDNALHKCIRTPSDNLTPDFVSVSSGDKDNRHDFEDAAQGDKHDELSETGTIRTGEEATQGDEDFKNADMSESGAIRADEIAAKGEEDFEVSDTIENDVARQINKLIDTLKHEDFNDDIRPEEPDIDVLYSKDDTQLKLPEDEINDIQNIVANADISDIPDLNKLGEIEDNIQQDIDNNATLLPAVDDYLELSVKQEKENVNNLLEDNISKSSDINDNIQNQTDANDSNEKENSDEKENSNEKENSDETETSNVSDTFEVISAELSHEYNRKVQFPKENLEPMIDIEQHNLINSETIQSENEQLLQDVAFEKSRSNIEFASPNEHLLSDADETWPDNVTAIRPGATVTRSISSMGKIVETDEKKSISLDGTEHPSMPKEKIHEKNDQEQNEYGVQNTETEIIDESSNEKKTDYSSQNARKIYETGDDEKNRHEVLNHTAEIMPHEHFEELGSAFGLDTTHDTNLSQKDNINISFPPILVSEKSAKLEQNLRKIHETGDDEKNRHENLTLTTKIIPHEQLEELGWSYGLDTTTHDTNDRQKDNINILFPPTIVSEKSAKPEQNRRKIYETVDEIISYDQLDEELGGAFGLDTTHDTNNRQIVNIDLLFPPNIVSENSARTGQKESVVIIGNEELQDSRNIRESELSEGKDSVAKTRDRSKRTEHSVEGSSRGHQRGASADGVITKKFDYRVHQKTAPSWIRCGQGEPTEHLCACRPLHHPAPFHHPAQSAHPDLNRMEEREQEIRKWCQELDFILKNLDNWKNWLNYVSRYITGLKQKADGRDDVWERRHRSRRTVDRLMRSFSPTNNEMWRKLNKEGLKQRRYDDAAKYKISPSPVKYCTKCGRRKASQTRKRHHRHHTRYHGEMGQHSHH